MATNPMRAAEEMASKRPNISWKGFVDYLKGVREELKKAVWPTRAELIRLTQIVLLLITIVALYCGALDSILGLITSRIFNKG
ncbi:MAG: preprotein translocase subunit SecE [Armatimonas sp.]